MKNVLAGFLSCATFCFIMLTFYHKRMESTQEGIIRNAVSVGRLLGCRDVMLAYALAMERGDEVDFEFDIQDAEEGLRMCRSNALNKDMIVNVMEPVIERMKRARARLRQEMEIKRKRLVNRK